MLSNMSRRSLFLVILADNGEYFDPQILLWGIIGLRDASFTQLNRGRWHNW